MRVALFCLVLATAAVCGSASPFSDTTTRSIQSALGQLGDSSHPEVNAVRKGFGLMTAPDCSQGTPCYQCALAMVDAIKPYQQANCDSAPSFSASNSSAVRDAYCSGNCYRAAVKLFRVFQVDPCLSYIRSTSSAASNLDFSFISNLLEYACVKNPVDGSYCSLTFASLGSGSSMSFIGGVNSTGCAALSDLGCCFQSTLDLINSTSFGALSYGITFNKVTDVYKNLCQLQGTPACPVLGVPTTQIKGTLVLRNLLFSYITDVTRAFVRRTIARAIYQSIISQNANLPITPASVQVTGFAQTTLPATTFQPTTVNQGVSVAFYVESPDDTYATSQLLAPVQAALANPDVTPLNVLPASAKVDNTASFSADTSASSATAQTTQDFSPASVLVPTSLSLILGVVGLVAVVMH